MLWEPDVPQEGIQRDYGEVWINQENHQKPLEMVWLGLREDSFASLLASLFKFPRQQSELVYSFIGAKCDKRYFLIWGKFEANKILSSSAIDR